MMDFVNGKDLIYIPYMKWKIKVMFETTNHSLDGRLQGKPMDLDGIPKKAI